MSARVAPPEETVIQVIGGYPNSSILEQVSSWVKIVTVLADDHWEKGIFA